MQISTSMAMEIMVIVVVKLIFLSKGKKNVTKLLDAIARSLCLKLMAIYITKIYVMIVNIIEGIIPNPNLLRIENVTAPSLYSTILS